METGFYYDEKELDALEAHITKRFGKFENVYHELVSPDIHCDIAIIPPRRDHPYYTLVTMGAGAYRMNLPEDIENRDDWCRAEYLINLPPDWKVGDADMQSEEWYWPVGCLKTMARYPIDNDTWLSWGHSVEIGVKYLLPEHVPFVGWLLTGPGAFGDESFCCALPCGEDVNFYQLQPLYAAEMKYKIKRGAEALLKRFAEAGEDYLSCISVTRPPVCKRRPGLLLFPR